MGQDERPMLCTARPEFAALTEGEIWAAIGKDTEDENPIVLEVLRLAAEFLTTFKRYIDQQGLQPQAMDFPVCCPIEKVAMEMTIRFVRSEASLAPRGKDT